MENLVNTEYIKAATALLDQYFTTKLFRLHITGREVELVMEYVVLHAKGW